ncbi:MAG: hypothetical protein Ct9H300mP11_14560 [Chloroflexota bacterium]|nr:MAG: hypothetical protein Ct9H300mP11_14560 [Chloroflexota bacterium]
MDIHSSRDDRLGYFVVKVSWIKSDESLDHPDSKSKRLSLYSRLVDGVRSVLSTIAELVLQLLEVSGFPANQKGVSSSTVAVLPPTHTTLISACPSRARSFFGFDQSGRRQHCWVIKGVNLVDSKPHLTPMHNRSDKEH